MREVDLFIAMSLDGYIADRTGGVSWLCGHDGSEEQGDGYDRFIAGVDTVLMGANTYRQITEELSPDAWPYDGLTTYVVTHRAQPDREGVRFTDVPPAALIRQLRDSPGKNIWICGGMQFIRQLAREDLIDRYILTVIPTLLGGGIPLFGGTHRELPLMLLHTQTCNGMVELTYVRRNAGQPPCRQTRYTMNIRPYRAEDCPALAALFYQTVHTVNARDYTPAQLNAWADGQADLSAWDRSFREHITLVAEEDGVILGFGDLALPGYLDRLYVRFDQQGRGVATALCDALEAHALAAVTTHASITAQPFFAARGYRVIRAQQVERRGVLLKNFVMRKEAAGQAPSSP